MEDNEIHYLADEAVVNLVMASQGKRLVNYLVDRIFISIIVYCLTLGLSQNGPIFQTSTDTEASIINFLISYLAYGSLMFLMEVLFKGKSLGKLFTKTRAVNEDDGSLINAKTAFLRSISRLVPFDVLSALGTPSYPWHDKWTNTMVVND